MTSPEGVVKIPNFKHKKKTPLASSQWGTKLNYVSQIYRYL